MSAARIAKFHAVVRTAFLDVALSTGDKIDPDENGEIILPYGTVGHTYVRCDMLVAPNSGTVQAFRKLADHLSNQGFQGLSAKYIPGLAKETDDGISGAVFIAPSNMKLEAALEVCAQAEQVSWLTYSMEELEEHRKLTAFRNAAKAHFLDYARAQRAAQDPKPSSDQPTILPVGTAGDSTKFACCRLAEQFHVDIVDVMQSLPTKLHDAGFPGLQFSHLKGIPMQISGGTASFETLVVAPVGMDEQAVINALGATEPWWLEYTAEELRQGH
jgi:hypothetical protein